MKSQKVAFCVEGSFDVPDSFSPINDAQGNVVGYLTPNGTQVQLAVCLEVTKDEKKYRYVSKESAMSNLGLNGLNYDRCEFYP